jgi:hypothetical protein
MRALFLIGAPVVGERSHEIEDNGESDENEKWFFVHVSAFRMICFSAS